MKRLKQNFSKMDWLSHNFKPRVRCTQISRLRFKQFFYLNTQRVKHYNFIETLKYKRHSAPSLYSCLFIWDNQTTFNLLSPGFYKDRTTQKQFNFSQSFQSFIIYYFIVQNMHIKDIQSMNFNNIVAFKYQLSQSYLNPVLD